MDLFIFFTGCLFMAMLYHFVLYIIQKNELLLLYSAYLFAATLFLAERVWIDATPLTPEKNFYFTLLDEPIQLFIYITYFLFVGRALKITSIADKKFHGFYWLVIWSLLLFSLFHMAGIIFKWFDSRTAWAFITVRVIMLASVLFMMFRVSKYITGVFFKFILAGSVIMLAGGLMAFLSSLFNINVFGIYGVTWSCLSLVLDVICFSAALGYKARSDMTEKHATLKQLFKTEQQLQQQELEKMSAIYLAREADRNRIARDLHDEIGSTLSSIHIYSSVAEKMLISSPEKTKKVLQQINTNSRMVMESMSDIVWAMKTGHDQDIMSNKIKNVGYEMLDSCNINCRYEIQDAADKADLDIDLRRNVLLIVKESLNNIVKYSNATEVVLKIHVAGEILNVSISDNGKGFDMQTAHKGNGLDNMQYRVEQYGGKINITSNCEGGTLIDCSFPITSNRDEIVLAEY